jgi:hypothetical protein
MLPDLPQTEIAIVEMTNAFRTENRLGTLKPNAALKAAARAFAAYLARTGTFAHAADGREPQVRAEAQGYRSCLVAENLALNLDSRGFESRQLAREAVEGWKASPGHRANMLQAGVTEIGVGVVRAPDRNPKFISVQLLGRPESLRIKFSVVNKSGSAVRYRLGEDAHTLPARTIVTHTLCDRRPLTFEQAGTGARFELRDGDRFTARTGAAGSVEVMREGN